jgi:hypothetical protein
LFVSYISQSGMDLWSSLTIDGAKNKRKMFTCREFLVLLLFFWFDAAREKRKEKKSLDDLTLASVFPSGRRKKKSHHAGIWRDVLYGETYIYKYKGSQYEKPEGRNKKKKDLNENENLTQFVLMAIIVCAWSLDMCGWVGSTPASSLSGKQ